MSGRNSGENRIEVGLDDLQPGAIGTTPPVMIQSIFTSLSFLSHLIFLIAYLHMPFLYFSSYLLSLSYLHVLSFVPILISYLLSCTRLVYKPNRYPETNQVCTLGNTTVLSTGSFLRLCSSLRLSLS